MQIQRTKHVLLLDGAGCTVATRQRELDGTDQGLYLSLRKDLDGEEEWVVSSDCLFCVLTEGGGRASLGAFLFL